MIDLSLPLF